MDILSGYHNARKGRRIERDVLFLERCIELLKPGGRIAIVLPHNKFGALSLDIPKRVGVKTIESCGCFGSR